MRRTATGSASRVDMAGRGGDTAMMLRDALDSLHPYGWTSRRAYGVGLLGLAAFLILFTLLRMSGLAPEWVLALLAIPALVVLVLLTIRRLRDAGLSVYWALLFFLPFRLTVDLATIGLGGAEPRFIDFNQILTALLLLVCLIVAGRPAAERIL